MIQRLQNNQIDKTRWDQAVAQSDHPHVYLLSWYLDIVSPGWEGLISDDYRAIMPLPVKYRWGIPYLVQPPLCQKTGVTGIGVKSSQARLFYRKIAWEFPYYNLQIGEATGLENRKYLNGRINYTLDLTPSHPVLVKDFHENTIRNLKKSIQAGLAVDDCSPEDYLRFSQIWMKGLNPEHSDIFASLIKACVRQKVARLLKTTGRDGNDLAAACFLVWNRQIVYLAGSSSDEGKRLSAMFPIFDKVITDYSGTGYLLDFEGSMIPGVARFFRGFGAKASYYYHIKKYLWTRI